MFRFQVELLGCNCDITVSLFTLLLSRRVSMQNFRPLQCGGDPAIGYKVCSETVLTLVGKCFLHHLLHCSEKVSKPSGFRRNVTV